MGRPIQKKWLGLPSQPGRQIVVNGVKFADGNVYTNAYIVKQTGSAKYMVQDTGKLHAPEIVSMVNAATTGALAAGQCFILATPYGGSALPCKKIAQFRVDVFAADGTVDSYSWSTIPASAPGQADLISSTTGGIQGVTMTASGYGYSAAPTVNFTGGGSGATGTAVIAGGVVTGVNVTAPGTGYTATTMTFAAPPANVLATGTAVLTADAVTSITVGTGGRYYATAPLVTLTGGSGTGATATATVTNGVVTSYTVTAGGTGYVSPPTVTVAAAPAVSTATGTAIIDQ